MPVLLGEMAHIVAESPEGPRGQSPFTLKERNQEPNLLLLCNVHHQLVDDQPETFGAERLLGFKEDHEAKVRDGKLPPADDPVTWKPALRLDSLYSTMLPVESLPAFVYAAEIGEVSERDIRAKLPLPGSGESVPFIVRSGLLLAFHDLTDAESPFSSVVGSAKTSKLRARDWWDSPDRLRWYVELLNRAMSRWTAQRGLRFDRSHHRYFFPPLQPGHPREVSYRPLNQSRAKRKVVWQPERKATGEPRPYWLHLAVSLRFLLVDPSTWCLAIRPGLRVTTDGEEPPPSDVIGGRVTRRMNKMFNYELLGLVHFWRDYLGDSQPRIIVRFGAQMTRGAQSLIVSTQLLDAVVEWPGIPSEFDRPFANVLYEEDLFSWAQLQEALTDQPSDEDWIDQEGDDADE